MVAYVMRCVAIVMLGFVPLLAGCPPSEMDLGYDDAGAAADCGSGPDGGESAPDACTPTPDIDGAHAP